MAYRPSFPAPPLAPDGGVVALASISAVVSIGVAVLIATTASLIAWPQGAFVFFLVSVAVAGIVPVLSRPADGTLAAGVLIGMFPAFYAAVTHSIDHWDDFWTWLPNAQHIAVFGMLPTEADPPVISKWPGYPPAFPLVIASLWRTLGVTLENAGPVMNVAALLVLAGLVWRVTAIAPGRSGFERFAIGVVTALAVTVCNPGLDWHWVRSSLPETLTLVAFAAALVTGAEMAFGTGRRTAHYLTFAALLALLVLLKQTGPVLVFVLGSALCAVTWLWVSRTALHGIRFVFVIATLCIPAIALWACWKFYLGEIFAGDEFILRPPADWHWSVLPSLARAVAQSMAGHWLFFAPIFVVVGRGWFLILRRMFGQESEAPTYADGLAAVFALVETAYLAFLTVCYLGALSAEEASWAAEFFRYQAHVGTAGLVAAAALAVQWLRGVRPLAVLAAVGTAEAAILASVFPLPALYTAPGVFNIKDVQEVRKLGEPIGQAIAAARQRARVEIVGPADDTYLATVILKYAIWAEAPLLVRDVAETLVESEEIVRAFTEAARRSDYAVVSQRIGGTRCAAFMRSGGAVRPLVEHATCALFYDRLDQTGQEDPVTPLSDSPPPSAIRNRT